MSLERDWDSIRNGRSFRVVDAGMGVLRIALLFGSAAIALALVAVPLLDSGSRQDRARDTGPFGLDMTSTGSIGGGTYTVRRSVLQPSPDSVCIIRSDGRRSGGC